MGPYDWRPLSKGVGQQVKLLRRQGWCSDLSRDEISLIERLEKFKRLYRNCPGRKNPAQSSVVRRGSPDRDLTFLGAHPVDSVQRQDPHSLRSAFDQRGPVAE